MNVLFLNSKGANVKISKIPVNFPMLPRYALFFLSFTLAIFGCLYLVIVFGSVNSESTCKSADEAGTRGRIYLHSHTR